MTKKRRARAIITLSALLLMTLAFTCRPDADKIRAAALSGPLKIHYIGRASLELPENFQPNPWSLKLLWPDSMRVIYLYDRPFSPEALKDPAEAELGLKMAAYHHLRPSKQRFRPEVYDRTEDLRAAFGGPARFYFTRFNSDRQMRMALAAARGPAYLLFSRDVLFEGDLSDQAALAQFTAEAKSWFLRQCQALAPAYGWNGRNQAPPSGRLATFLGSIDLSGLRPEPLATASVFFRPGNQAYPSLNIVVTGDNAAAPNSDSSPLAGLPFWFNGVGRRSGEAEVDGRKGDVLIKVDREKFPKGSYYEANWLDKAGAIGATSTPNIS